MQALSVHSRILNPRHLLWVTISLALAWLFAWQIHQPRTPLPFTGVFHSGHSGHIRSLGAQPPANSLALTYSTYLGGNRLDEAEAVTTDRDGNVYVVGLTSSSNFPTKNAVQATRGGGDDAYIVKLSPTGEIIYSTYLGGSDDDEAVGIAVDASGAAYIIGTTLSTNFPTKNAMQSRCGGTFGICVGDAFVTKLSPDGSTILYSTYLGGSLPDDGSAIAVDGAGNAYVLGETFSPNFPLKGALQTSRRGEEDLFIAKLDTTKSGADSYLFGTYFGGNALENAEGIAVSSAGNIHLIGDTLSSDFPTEKAAQGSSKGLGDAFVTKLSPDASTILYSTYLGGSKKDYGYDIAVDGAGNAYITGDTQSSDFTTKNALADTFGGGMADAFAAKFSNDGTLVYSTFLGGSDSDYGRAIAVNGAGEAYVAGYTQSSNFPLQDSLQPLAGESDVFVAKLSEGGTALQLSTLFGGNSADIATGVALDSDSNIIVAGLTFSSDFPTKNAAQSTYGGGLFDGFVAKLGGTGSEEGLVANVSAASYRGDTLAVEGIIAAFGSHLATASGSAATKPLPTELAGTTVLVRDSAGVERMAPLFYVSPTQINYQMPPGTAVGRAKVTIKAGDGKISSEMVQVAAIAPSQFSADASGRGYAAAVVQRNKADGTTQYEVVVKYDNSLGKWVAVPIELGAETDQVFLLLYGTGIRFRSSQANVRVTLGGSDAEVLYASLQPDYIGVDQVSVRLPRSLMARGEIQVTLTADGQVANSVSVSIR